MKRGAAAIGARQRAGQLLFGDGAAMVAGRASDGDDHVILRGEAIGSILIRRDPNKQILFAPMYGRATVLH
jgi:hypothetical protein